MAYPYKLYAGDYFRSYGGYNGRYKAETWGRTYGYWGYTTCDSRWVRQVDIANCYS